MTEVRTRRPSTAVRRGNAVAAVLADVLLQLLVHVWPMWRRTRRSAAARRPWWARLLAATALQRPVG